MHLIYFYFIIFGTPPAESESKACAEIKQIDKKLLLDQRCLRFIVKSTMTSTKQNWWTTEKISDSEETEMMKCSVVLGLNDDDTWHYCKLF